MSETSSPDLGCGGLTVITAVKDDPQGWSRTKRGMSDQVTPPHEWIIVSSSRDAEDISDLPASLLGRTRVVQTAARGVYSAMNEGLRVASGDYVMFHNAGDVLAHPHVVAELMETLVAQHPIWMYGRVVFVNQMGLRKVQKDFDYSAERAHAFRRGRFPSQAATVASVEALRRLGGFDERYVIAADYRMMLGLAREGDPIIVEGVVVEFAVGGLSWTNWRLSLREALRARREAGFLSATGSATEALASIPLWIRTACSRTLDATAIQIGRFRVGTPADSSDEAD